MQFIVHLCEILGTKILLGGANYYNRAVLENSIYIEETVNDILGKEL